jgi:hypothetical protein
MSHRTLHSVLAPIGGGLVVLGLLVSVLHLPIGSRIVPLAERYLSPDQHITSVSNINVAVLIAGILSIVSGLLILMLRNRVTLDRAIQAFRTDELLPNERLVCRPLVWFAVSSCLSAVMAVLFFLWGNGSFVQASAYAKEGPVEMLSGVVMLGTSVLLLSAALVARRKASPSKRSLRRGLAVTYVLLAVVFFFFAMEEFSWGQHVIGWAAPRSWSEINLQNETTVHNLVWFPVARTYQVLTSLLFLVFISGWVLVDREKSVYLRYVLPHPSLITVVGLLLLAGLSAGLWNELVEELGALFGLLYAGRVLLGVLPTR